MAYQLPPLPYDYAALEPHIDAETMRIHHDKHHQAYVDKTNAALQGTEWADRPIEEVLQNLDSIPEETRAIVRNNGGGHANHTLFWEVMSPDGGGAAEGELAAAIEESFSSYDAFKDAFGTAAVNQFGSGWAWLVWDGTRVASTALVNQDSPVLQGLIPILGLDVWEHAYYLRYQNRRPEYVEAWWNVVNWPAVAERFEIARGRVGSAA